MCLAVPGRIIEILDEGQPSRRGRVDFAGVVREVCLGLTPEAGPGDWVIVHAGFAIGVLNDEEARNVLDELARLGQDGRKEEPE
jgi:hydrogenase expression/formation protein HypC